MKLTLKELTDKYKEFSSIAVKRLPAKLSYAISKNMTMLEKEVKLIDDNRIKLAQTYAEKNEDGTPKIVENSFVISDIESFNRELMEYYKAETDVEVCKVNPSELDKLDDPRYDALSPAEIKSLQFMFEENKSNIIEK